MPPRIRPTGRAAALVAGLLTVLAVTLPPAAATTSDKVALSLKDVPRTMVAYRADEGAEATNGDFQVPVAVVPGNKEPARNIKVVVDASGLKDIARVTEGGYGNCTGSGWVYTCSYGTLLNDGESNAPFDIVGLDGVEPGDSGTVTYTASADNAAPVTGTTRMVVGGPTLGAPGGETKVSGVKPGQPAALTPMFANHTTFPADRGVALHVRASDGLTLKARHSNCTYTGASSTSAWCVFPAGAAPGAAYRTSAPIVYVAGAEQLHGTLTYSWSASPEKHADHAVRGRGAPITLVPTADGTFGSTDGTVQVETTAQADYRPVTATVRGHVGDTVEVRLGVRALGPVTPRGNEVRGRFEVVPPEGTTVTSIPYAFEETDRDWGCDRPEEPGGAFVCDLEGEALSWAGEDDGTTTLVFHVRIDRQVAKARGTIRVYAPYDRTPGNDTAAIPLDASPAPAYRAVLRPVVWIPVTVAALVTLTALHRRHRRRAG
ncbi:MULTISPECIES: hypothetical protein [unclassified Streptomyces]|uniref:hypothetical protein n=1 Tax=unclassified Streptomyces TaxID=2593676 RepID=UPI0029BE55D2|nr:hypothetical protein [Streptomyces sp. AK04-4c]MDX3683745.1 hypothetical protein [Streptomyces sp. AK04-4c]